MLIVWPCLQVTCRARSNVNSQVLLQDLSKPWVETKVLVFSKNSQSSCDTESGLGPTKLEHLPVTGILSLLKDRIYSQLDNWLYPQ